MLPGNCTFKPSANESGGRDDGEPYREQSSETLRFPGPKEPVDGLHRTDGAARALRSSSVAIRR